jgi:hypothetical protein
MPPRGWRRPTRPGKFLCPVCGGDSRVAVTHPSGSVNFRTRPVGTGTKRQHRCRVCFESFWSFEDKGVIRVFSHHFEVEDYLALKPSGDT